MLVEHQSASIIASALAAGLVAASSSTCVVAIGRRLVGANGKTYDSEKPYEDEDGQATAESEQRMVVTFIPKLAAVTASLLGVAVALSYAILASDARTSNGRLPYAWLNVASWALLFLQSLCVFVEREHVTRFHYALLAVLSSCFIALSLFLEHQTGIFRSLPVSDVLNALAWAQAGLLLLAFAGFSNIQRRPDVFLKGKPVDGQFTASAFSRLAFQWAAPSLAYARKHKNLELEDIPRLSAYQRSQFMESQFTARDNGMRLWKLLVILFWRPFARQVLLTSLATITQFGPQLAMFELLKLLEDRSNGADRTRETWFWALALGATMLLSTMFESWLFFVVYADLSMPIHSMLSILVFSKATRRKDVKGAQKKKEQSSLEAQVLEADRALPAGGRKGPDEGTKSPGKKDGSGESGSSDNDEDDEDEDSVTKSKQATINLVGVDAERVSDLCSFVYLYPGAVLKLAVSMTFLTKLVGWKSLLSGLAAFACTLPVNIVVSKLYNDAQGKLMSVRDAKLAVVNEALQGIRQIKFSAIEKQWQAKIEEKREAELKVQWSVFGYDTVLLSIWVFGPVMLSAICLCVFAYLNDQLSPSIAFTTIAVLSQIEMTLAVLPELTAIALDSWVACKRIEKFLRSPEKTETTIPGETVVFEDATVAWPADDQEEDPDRFTLKRINIEFPARELSVISGKTGSGKSLLLAAILGEIDRLEGNIRVPRPPKAELRFDHKATPGNWIIDSSIAFVAQVPWIENATIKDNILFGLPFDQGRYRKTLQVCALEKDLDILPDRDLTDIGANGINLSGGQRWRVSFARAVYSRAGILVLDDIFSAVDAHVGRQLFEEALTGDLGIGRTRILVTHHVGLCLPKTKYAVHLGEGTVQYAGLVEDLRRDGALADILKEEEAEATREGDLASETNEEIRDHLAVEENGAALAKTSSRRSVRSAKVDDGELDIKGKKNPKKFNEEEKRETGVIKISVYWKYIVAGGGLLLWIPLVSTYVSAAGLTMGRSYWITLWTRSYKTEHLHVLGPYYYSDFRGSISNNLANNHISSGSEDSVTSLEHGLWYWLGIYFGLSVCNWLVTTLTQFSSFVASIKASKRLFKEMNHAILRAPLRWLDTIPIGRILNRFSSDFNTIDSRMAQTMGYFFYRALEMAIITAAGFIASPIMVPLAVILIGMAVWIMHLFLGGAREVKRLESNAKSPIFSDFGALLSGVATVRAFDRTATFVDRMYTKIDAHGAAFYHIWLFNRWMSLRLSVTGTTFAVAVAIIVVASDEIDAALAGFALNFALRYSSSITWTMRSYSNLEMDLNSAERIIEYANIGIEEQAGDSPPAAWPTSGSLEVNDLDASYAPDLPSVLKGLTFSIESGQRVGVVGRTGAGKSSLTLALFRFIHQRGGTVHIDGLDVSKLKLHDFRSRLAIIPQDPVLFSGTIRSNLDPFNQHSDEELRVALQRVHLVEDSSSASGRASVAEAGSSGQHAETTANSAPSAGSDQAVSTGNKNIFTSLSSKISEGGLNLSQGQRQLLCLARAIVSRPRLMFLDEATSAVDMATDELIQRSIREEFTGSTLLVIAHRLSTIADFDRILVMSEGRAVEFGTPAELMEMHDGVFRSMVEQSGESERLVQIIKHGTA